MKPINHIEHDAPKKDVMAKLNEVIRVLNKNNKSDFSRAELLELVKQYGVLMHDTGYNKGSKYTSTTCSFAANNKLDAIRKMLGYELFNIQEEDL